LNEALEPSAHPKRRKLMRRTVWLGALALILVACSGGPGTSDQSNATTSTTESTTTTPPAETETSPPPEDASSGDLDIIVPPGADGSLPGELWIGCWSGPHFQVSDLENVEALATADPGGVAEAIEPFLSSGEGEFWPQEGWLILREKDDEVLLVHQGSEGLAFMNVSRVDGAWMWSGSQMGGPCPLHYAVPEGLNAVDWVLDPSGLPLDPADTSLEVIATERECVSGQEMGDRLLEPQVVMTADEVRVVLAAEPPPGDVATCQGNPETPVTIALPQPLGDREVLEGYEIGIDLEDFLP
jgi:hypothetical protein